MCDYVVLNIRVIIAAALIYHVWIPSARVTSFSDRNKFCYCQLCADPTV